MGIRDFLPLPPWEGLPIPRILSKQEEPATPTQLRTIARLTAALRMPEPKVYYKGEAGRLIRELEQEIKYRRGK